MDRGSSSGSVSMNSVHKVIPNSGKGKGEACAESIKGDGQSLRVMFECTAPDMFKKSMLRLAAALDGPLHCDL